MPTGNKGNELPQKNPKDLLTEIAKKCNGDNGRYKTRKMVADTKHEKIN